MFASLLTGNCQKKVSVCKSVYFSGEFVENRFLTFLAICKISFFSHMPNHKKANENKLYKHIEHKE